MGRATTLFNVQNRIGSALGVVVIASILESLGTSTTDVSGVTLPYSFAYEVALWGSAALLIVALIFALYIRSDDIVTTKPEKVVVN